MNDETRDKIDLDALANAICNVSGQLSDVTLDEAIEEFHSAVDAARKELQGA